MGKPLVPGAPDRRRPFSRTVSRARWSEYRKLLQAAGERGYELLSLEDWLLDHRAPSGPTIILRHDVDQHPRSALPILAIERELGIRSTWYFRWRTASAPIIEAVRAAGGHVGLHYETLTRLVRDRGLTASDVDRELIFEARELLRREIDAFMAIFGPIRTICPHGDSRVPGVSNQVLLEGQESTHFGIALDGNDAVNRFPLSLWLTDRSTAEGRWKDGLDPHQVLADGVSPILLVIHPNNWCSGVSLWRDRLLAAALPARGPQGPRRPRIVRTGSDEPPPLPPAGRRGAGTSRTADATSIALSLQREVLRFNYDTGKSMTDPAGLNTLATNANLAESRVVLLERALAEAGVRGIDGLDVLDVGCGFGALSLVFASRGARVLALDPNEERMSVGRTVAEMHGMPVRFHHSSMEELDLGPARFDVAVMNNSLCYVVRTEKRSEALRRTLQALRPGGVVVIRNPNRIHPRDQFTGIPLLGMLPPFAARRIAALLGRHRSNVRLLSNRAARRELRRAGYRDVRTVRREGELRLRATVTGYQHLIGRRPW
jgi:2-polyprenyl-3-methyl-5-hydroxy-6-metoxy-1,4-benzoquinol methylase